MARLGTTADYFLGEGDAERPPMQPWDESPTVTPCPCDGDKLNCSDFANHNAAQACFNWHVSQGAGDIHKLGALRAQDNDGIACESLPGGFRVLR